MENSREPWSLPALSTPQPSSYSHIVVEKGAISIHQKKHILAETIIYPKVQGALDAGKDVHLPRRTRGVWNHKTEGMLCRKPVAFFNYVSLPTSYAMVFKKKKKGAFCSAKFPTILISLSFEPFNWQCQMQFVFCSKANALKWLSQYEPWQFLILLGLKGRLTTEYCSHMPSEFHDTMLRLLCKG